MSIATNFGLIDWIIVVAYLAGSLAIGVYAHRFIGRAVCEAREMFHDLATSHNSPPET
jgi:hypothetical protein